MVKTLLTVKTKLATLAKDSKTAGIYINPDRLNEIISDLDSLINGKTKAKILAKVNLVDKKVKAWRISHPIIGRKKHSKS